MDRPKCKNFRECGCRLAKGDRDGLCSLCRPDRVTTGGLQPSGWPLVSLGMGVHPDQIAEATARNKAHGVNVQYRRDGRAVIPDAGERKKLMKLDGVFDKDAFC